MEQTKGGGESLIMTRRESKNHIIMLKQSAFHSHLLTILITHLLINVFFNLLPSNTKLSGRSERVLFFLLLFLLLLAVYCLPPQKALLVI